jgi:hypothetical protein
VLSCGVRRWARRSISILECDGDETSYYSESKKKWIEMAATPSYHYEARLIRSGWAHSNVFFTTANRQYTSLSSGKGVPRPFRRRRSISWNTFWYSLLTVRGLIKFAPPLLEQWAWESQTPDTRFRKLAVLRANA